ncbi:uncharacterized protein SCHCODRAFT_02567991 [Schizophyllum commune H4-8]|nr:uncharacterized protein SCHCODRAFT_02567991 [Schizophyllum commune H4-8]KAI5898939.1 hypothetical protein SCHCODRAFT_02567991 [Schizophyllum commune H4-8]
MTLQARRFSIQYAWPEGVSLFTRMEASRPTEGPYLRIPYLPNLSMSTSSEDSDVPADRTAFVADWLAAQPGVSGASVTREPRMASRDKVTSDARPQPSQTSLKIAVFICWLADCVTLGMFGLGPLRSPDSFQCLRLVEEEHVLMPGDFEAQSHNRVRFLQAPAVRIISPAPSVEELSQPDAGGEVYPESDTVSSDRQDLVPQSGPCPPPHPRAEASSKSMKGAHSPRPALHPATALLPVPRSFSPSIPSTPHIAHSLTPHSPESDLIIEHAILRSSRTPLLSIVHLDANDWYRAEGLTTLHVSMMMKFLSDGPPGLLCVRMRVQHDSHKKVDDVYLYANMLWNDAWKGFERWCRGLAEERAANDFVRRILTRAAALSTMGDGQEVKKFSALVEWAVYRDGGNIGSTGTKVTEIQFPSTTGTPRAPSDGAADGAGQFTPVDRRASTGRPTSGPAVTEIEFPSSEPQSSASRVLRVVVARSVLLKRSPKQLSVACLGHFLLVHGLPEMGWIAGQTTWFRRHMANLLYLSVMPVRTGDLMTLYLRDGSRHILVTDTGLNSREDRQMSVGLAPGPGIVYVQNYGDRERTRKDSSDFIGSIARVFRGKSHKTRLRRTSETCPVPAHRRSMSTPTLPPVRYPHNGAPPPIPYALKSVRCGRSGDNGRCYEQQSHNHRQGTYASSDQPKNARSESQATTTSRASQDRSRYEEQAQKPMRNPSLSQYGHSGSPLYSRRRSSFFGRMFGQRARPNSVSSTRPTEELHETPSWHDDSGLGSTIPTRWGPYPLRDSGVAYDTKNTIYHSASEIPSTPQQVPLITLTPASGKTPSEPPSTDSSLLSRWHRPARRVEDVQERAQTSRPLVVCGQLNPYSRQWPAAQTPLAQTLGLTPEPSPSTPRSPQPEWAQRPQGTPYPGNAQVPASESSSSSYPSCNGDAGLPSPSPSPFPVPPAPLLHIDTGSTMAQGPVPQTSPSEEPILTADERSAVPLRSPMTLIGQLQSALQDVSRHAAAQHQHQTGNGTHVVRVDTATDATEGPRSHILSSDAEPSSIYESRGTTTATMTVSSAPTASRKSEVEVVEVLAVQKEQARRVLDFLFFWFFLCFVMMFTLIWPLAEKLHAQMEVDADPGLADDVLYL